MTEKEDATKEPDKEPLDDKALEKLAVDELIQEAVQGAIRAEQQGPSGWIKAKPQPKTNKRFLVNTLRNTVSSNNYHSSRSRQHTHRSESQKHTEYKAVPTIKKDKSKRKH
ncbi:protein POLR1D-like [Epargyreus clarus]|uniref:protein POLR1D-like n=1 Tax=Epargyreus clarus TaxID=520877 RepID=UPI003C2FCA7D